MPSHEQGPAPGLLDASIAIEEHSKGKRKRRRALVLLFSLVLLMLIIELGLRLGGARARDYAAQNTELLVELSRAGMFQRLPEREGRYGLRPGTQVRFGDLEYRSSNQGTRGPDLELEKPEGERRLLVLGDGLAMGLGCAEDQTLAANLARLANRAEEQRGSALRWRGISLGVPGYRLEQAAQLLAARGLALQPDLVLLAFNLSDLEGGGLFLDSSGGLQRDALPLPSSLRSLLWGSHLYGWIVGWHRRAMESGGVSPELATEVPYAWVHAHNQAAAKEALGQLAEACREAGVGLFVLDQALSYEPDAEHQQRLDELRGWCAATRGELQVAGYSLEGQALSSLSSPPSAPGLVLDAEAYARAATFAFAELQAAELLP